MKKIIINNSVLIGEEITIGENLVIGNGNMILASRIRIGSNVTVGSNNNVLIGENFELGDTTSFGNNNLIEGKSVFIGENVWWGDENVLGNGGKWNARSNFYLGSFSMVVGKCIFNLSDQINIGEDVGIGGEVNIWTHGVYLPILMGYPSQFGPVIIGDHVWLPSRSIVLPNISIGSNVVIGINSLINKNIPNGCLAAGIPIRIIKTNAYPNQNHNMNEDIIHDILKEYEELKTYKGIDLKISYLADKEIILCNNKEFNLKNMIFPEELTSEEEDFRDYLRRKGIKFFGKKPFKSILPSKILKLKEFYEQNKKN